MSLLPTYIKTDIRQDKHEVNQDIKESGRLIIAADFPSDNISEKYMTYMNEDTLELYEYDGLQWVSKTSISDSVSLELDQLINVNTSTATSGQVLKYNGIDWINQNDVVGSGTVTAVNGVLPDGTGDVTQYIGQLGNVITDGTVGSILRISAPGPPGEGVFEQLNPGDESQVLSINSGVPIWKDLPDIPVIGVNASEVLDNESLIVPKSVLVTDSITSKQKSLTSVAGGMLRYNKTTADPETFKGLDGEIVLFNNGIGTIATGPIDWGLVSGGVGVSPVYADLSSRVETLTNKSIDGFQNTLINVIENVTINRVAKSGPVFLPNLQVGAFVDNQPVALNDKVLLTKQFTASEQGLYLVNSAPNPPTRLDENYNSSRKRYICIGGDLYTNSIWMCNNETGSDVGGVDVLQFRRIDNDAKLHGGMYQNIASVSQTLNATINTYDKLGMFDTASATSGSVSVNTFDDTITLPNTTTKVYEIEYSISWNSTTGGAKEYTLGVFVDGILCRASESSRSLPNNLIGETSGSCVMSLPTGSTHVIDLRAKSDTASVNITTNSGHLRVREVS